MHGKRKRSGELAMTMEEAQLDRQLNTAIRDAIKHVGHFDYPVTLEKVYVRVSATNADLIDRIRIPFSNRHVRVKIQHCLRRSEPPLDADGAGFSPDQPELDIPDIEKFRGVPEFLPVSYAFWQAWNSREHPDDPAAPPPIRRGMIYLNYYKESDRGVRAEMLRVKDLGIRADTVSRQRLAAQNSVYDSLVPMYGDLPPEELERLWLAGDQYASHSTV